MTTQAKVYSKFCQETTLGNMGVHVELQRMRSRIDMLCYCRMPESFGDLIQCAKCNLYYHQKCYLFNLSQSLCERIEFICYQCRGLGDYTFLTVKGNPDDEAIERAGRKISKLPGVKMQNLARAKSVRSECLFSNWKTFNDFERLVLKYDLNKICRKSGEIYNGIYNFYVNSDHRFKEKYPFDELPPHQVFHFAILLICAVENIQLHPLTEPTNAKYKTLKQVLQENTKWIEKLLKVKQKIENDMAKFLALNKPVDHSHTEVSHFSSELKKLSDYLKRANEDLTSCSLSVSTERDLERKEIQLKRIYEIGESVSKLVQKLDDFKNC